jgi:hypothetical protein
LVPDALDRHFLSALGFEGDDHRVVDRLIAHYGEDAVFPDIVDIPPDVVAITSTRRRPRPPSYSPSSAQDGRAKVVKETRYAALTRQAASVEKMPDIMPVFLEPDAPRPPEWLKGQHFHSLVRLATRGAAAEAKPRSN